MAGTRTADLGQDDAEYALGVAQTIAAIYMDAEDALFQSFADHLWQSAMQAAKEAPARQQQLMNLRTRAASGDLSARKQRELLAELRILGAGGEDPKMVRDYLERRQSEVKQLRLEANRIVQRLERRVFSRIVDGITAGWRRGVKRAIDDIDTLGSKKGVATGQGVVEIARQMVKNLRRRHISALRTIDDEFQMVNRTVIGRVLAGAETVDQAVERELAAYARKGISEFVDRAGKRWDLPTYAEMAVRTSVIRAATDGHLATLERNDFHFVIATKEAYTCPRCAPWEGEILAVGDGPTGDVQVTHYLTDEPMMIHVRGTVEFARRTGFQHPNCGHTLGLYTPGVTQVPERPASKATYEDSQKQRHLENELRVAKRRAALARTPAKQKAARARMKELSGRLDELTAETGLRRRRNRERAGDISAEKVEQAKATRIAAQKTRKVAEQAAQKREREPKPPPASSGSRPMSGSGSQGAASSGSGQGGISPGQQEARRIVEGARPIPRGLTRPEEEPPASESEGPGNPASSGPDDESPPDDDKPNGSGGGSPRPPATPPNPSAGGATGTRQQDTAGQQEQARLWTRDLHDPADRPNWFTQAELDDAQLVQEADGSFVVVVAGEVVGRVRRRQAAPGWVGQNVDRSPVGKTSAKSRQEMVDRLVNDVQARWRKAHGITEPAASPEETFQRANARYDQIRQARDRAQERAERLARRVEYGDDEAEAELEAVEKKRDQLSKQLGQLAADVRKARQARTVDTSAGEERAAALLEAIKRKSAGGPSERADAAEQKTRAAQAHVEKARQDLEAAVERRKLADQRRNPDPWAPDPEGYAARSAEDAARRALEKAEREAKLAQARASGARSLADKKSRPAKPATSQADAPKPPADSDADTAAKKKVGEEFQRARAEMLASGRAVHKAEEDLAELRRDVERAQAVYERRDRDGSQEQQRDLLAAVRHAESLHDAALEKFERLQEADDQVGARYRQAHRAWQEATKSGSATSRPGTTP